MAAQVILPNYSLMGPAPDPMRNVEAGLQVYGALKGQQQKQEALDIEKQRAAQQGTLSQLQEQQLQQEIGQEPQTFATQQKTAALQQGLVKVQASHLKAGISQNDLADIHDMPDAQKPAAYQRYRTKMIGLGANPNSLPPTYNPDVVAQVNAAYSRSPAAAATRKLHNDIFMQKLKNLGGVQAAQAKATAAAEAASSPAAMSAKAESATFSDALKTAQADAGAAESMNQKINNAMAQVKAYAGHVGPVIGKAAWMTPEGQNLEKSLQAIGLQNLKGAKGIRNWMEFKAWMNNLGSATMNASAIMARLNEALQASKLKINKFHYYSSKIQEGKDRPIKIMSDWSNHANTVVNNPNSPQRTYLGPDGHLYTKAQLTKIAAGGTQ